MTEIKKLLIQLAAFYGFDMTDVQLKLWAEFLSRRVTPAELATACEAYCDDPKNEFFPRPVSKLVALAHPQLSDEDTARDVAARIIGAIRRFGRYDGEGAHAAMGELGWLACRRLGGWSAVCDLAHTENLPTLQAQLRDLSKSLSAQARLGIQDTPPALPASQKERKELGSRQAVSGLISDLAKQKTIPGKETKDESSR